jgi:hypothetical protein
LSEKVRVDSQIKFFLGKGNQQVRAYYDPDLTVDCILASPIKCLDMQMLLSPFIEEFHLTSFPVELCDGQGGKVKVIGHKGVRATGGIIFIYDQTKDFGVGFEGFITGQFYQLIANKAGLPVNLCRGDDFIFDIVFRPGNKECTRLMNKGIQPIKINVSLIEDII